MARNHFTRFREGVQISGIAMNVHQKGRVFYVCNSTTPAPFGSTGSNGSVGLTPENPFKTVKAALANNLIKANRGDKLIVMPGHAETVANATDLAVNVAGVSIVGVGEGALKPTFTMSAAGSNIPVSVNDVSIEGIRLVASATSVTAGMTITGTGARIDIETLDTDSTHCFAIGVLTTAAAANLLMNLRHQGFSGSSVMTSYVQLVGVVGCDINLDYYGNASTGVVNMVTTANKNVRVTGTFYNANASLTKNVVDSASSDWDVDAFEAKAGQAFAGSNNTAVSYLAPLATTALVSAIKVIPQTTTTTVFTVSGGPILVEYFAAEVTTVVQTQACNLKFTATDTASSTATDICANLNITAAPVGAFLWVKMDALATALQSTTGAGLGPTITTGVIIPAGTVAATTSASNTGNIKYHLRYKALDPNATVVMA